MSNSAFLTLIRQSWRSIWRNWRRTLITISAISLGVGMAVLFMALGQGVYTEMIDTAVKSLGGHFTIEHKDYRDSPSVDLFIEQAQKLQKKIESFPQIKGSKILVLGQGVYKSARGTTGGIVMGINPDTEKHVSDLPEKMVAGEYLTNADKGKVIVGKTIADQLKLKIGRKIIISANDAEGELSEYRYRVKGIFETKSPELDAAVVQMTVQTAQELFGLKPDQVSQLGFLVKNPKDRDDVLEQAQGLTKSHGGSLVALPWETVQKELADYIRVDRGGKWIMQFIIIGLCLFTIWNTILMSVLERSREFAVMLALGTSFFRLRSQVAIESCFIGLFGVGLGLSWGGGLAAYLGKIGLDIMQLTGGKETNVAGFAIEGIIYPKVEPEFLLYFGGGVFIAAIIMSIVASHNVRKIQVTDVLR
jgi:ABC-type lipoprotein release transport system permease subunit